MKFRNRKETWDFGSAFQEPVAAVPEGRSRAVGRTPIDADFEGQHGRTTLQLYWRFFRAAVTRRGQTGAIVPSLPALIDRMIVPVPANYRGEVVELGAGTGVLTFRLAERCPKARIIACEINPALAGDLETRIIAAGLGRRVRVNSDPAEHLLPQLTRNGAQRPEFILSGIPLGNLPKKRAVALIEAIHRALAPGGLYVQFQYSLIDRRKVERRFSRLRTSFVLLNIPPAFVYYASK